ncbi:MAG: ribonuclease domain-containing protein [Eubacteriales bacterium]|nr:ribonuclease domain-containing protein [Eubacteriales bacterium]
MKKTVSRLLLWLTLLTVLLGGCLSAQAKEQSIKVNAADYEVVEDGSYTSMEEVAVYLTTYGRLPDNFITKKEAEKLGWNNRKGNLDEVAPGCSIGGDYFGNYEGSLPTAKGRKWTECDINFDGGYRGGERIAFSNDELIYYTDDHYNTFRRITVVQK